jgi:hypothetical protein
MLRVIFNDTKNKNQKSNKRMQQLDTEDDDFYT